MKSKEWVWPVVSFGSLGMGSVGIGVGSVYHLWVLLGVGVVGWVVGTYGISRHLRNLDVVE